MAYPNIKERKLFSPPEAPRTDIESRVRALVGAPRQHFPCNYLENRLHLNVSTHRLQNFSLEISNFVVPLYNIASTHTNHSMVSVKQVLADAHRWDVIEFPTISQLNCVPKLPLVKSEVHFFQRYNAEPTRGTFPLHELKSSLGFQRQRVRRVFLVAPCTVSFHLTCASLRAGGILIVKRLYGLLGNLFHKGDGCFDGASYSCRDWLTGFTRPRPPMRTGNARRSRSVSTTWCSRSGGIRTSEMKRTEVSSKSAIPGSVPKRYGHRRRRPNIKAAHLAWGRDTADSANFITWLTHSSTFSPTYSSKWDLDPRAAPSCLYPSIVMLIALSSSSFLGFVISHHFLAFGKYPSTGPLEYSSFHHRITFSSVPLPVGSSANQHCLAELEVRSWAIKVVSRQQREAHRYRVSLSGSFSWQYLFSTHDEEPDMPTAWIIIMAASSVEAVFWVLLKTTHNRKQAKFGASTHIQISW